MTNVAITGCSGYLGNKIIENLEIADDVESIIGLDIKPPRKTTKKLKFITQNILEPYNTVLADNKVDAAIHLAFAVGPTQNIEAARRLDIDGAKIFMDSCKKASVKRVLYPSSLTAYGAYPDNPAELTEDMPLRPFPDFLYSWDKAQADQMFQEFAKENPEICVTIIRTGNVLGPTGVGSINSVTYLVPMVMMRIMGCDPKMQYLHEDDLGELFSICITKDVPGVYNAASEGSLKYSEIISLTGKLPLILPSVFITPLLQFSWKLKLQSKSPPRGLDFIKYPLIMNTEKIQKATGFKFRTTRQAVTEFLAALKK